MRVPTGGTWLYEAADVMLTLYKASSCSGLGFRSRQTINDAQARVALARRLAIIMNAMLRH